MSLPVIERLMRRVEIDPETGCWNWTGALVDGYGRIRVGDKVQATHRVAYEHHVGPIPAGLPLDHQCNNTRCCNPAHLEPATHWANILRGNGVAAQHARQTHCKRGHDFTPENTLATSRGGRECLECKRWRQREFMRRKLGVKRPYKP